MNIQNENNNPTFGSQALEEKEMLVLDVQDLWVEYRTDTGIVKALNGLELQVKKGETLGLVGETGAGKTTAGLSILGLIPNPPGKVARGSIKLNGDELLGKSDKQLDKIRGKSVAMIFQDPMTALNPVQRIEDQIAEGIRLHKKLSKKDALAEARAMLEKVGIPAERGREYPHQFSGGMKQRVVIAIALSCNPMFLIADEPTTALDVTIQAQILDMMKSLQKELNTSMLMITHDLGIVVEICDKVSVVYAGRVIEHGTLKDIYKNTKHPYTVGLFNSLPNLEDRRAKLEPIPGLMPDPINLPTGCAFCPRCKNAMPICEKQKPSRVYFNDTHYVECHLYSNAEDGGEVNESC